MIVDDEKEIRQALTNYIPWQNMGFRVVYTAENGEEAFNYIMENEVDVVLCDVKMPVMNGIELAKTIYNKKVNIKVIFLSAYRDFDYAKKALIYDVEDYIVKPTKYQELVDVFKKVKNNLENDTGVLSNKQNFGADKRKEIDNIAKTNSSQNYNEKIISKVKKIVRQDYKNVSLKTIARKVHLSPSYLSKFFKDLTGENFSDYVLGVKMEEAKKLLMDIDYCIYEVSEILGYSNPKNFSRAFKCFTGKTPSEYRKGD